MVSVAKIGQVFKTNTSFNAKPVGEDRPIDREKLKAFATNQVNLGYGVMGAGLLALTTPGLKKSALKYIAPIPAAVVCMMVGGNMFSGGHAIKKAMNSAQQNTLNKQA